ncbi:MAG: hypothetical protein Q9168_002926 [Polycauliona sp. 1 TL-2023]
MALFPTCHVVRYRPPFLVVVCSTLPAKPWPTTVAGLPLSLTDDHEEETMDFGIMCSGPKLTIDVSMEYWKTPTMEIFKMVYQALDPYNIEIDRIQWIGWPFLALAPKTPTGNWRKTLPWNINGIAIGYVFGDESTEELIPGKPNLASTSITGEYSTYDDMRPTLTVAAEHLSKQGDAVGETVHLDTPGNERWEGTLIGVQVLRIPGDNTRDAQYIAGDVVYFGDGAEDIFDGSCGGVVWNEQLDVVGQAPGGGGQPVESSTARASRL